MTTQSLPLPNAPPWLLDPSARWVTAREFASLYRRSLRRVQQMCLNGDIIDFCVATYQDPMGRWWLRIPN